ncbi:hypothetical protein HYZ41_01540 [archaeon]|nr:hypothetical protein [archaeon]
MEQPDIFRFEKKKIILPTILVILFLFVLSFSAIYSEQMSKDVHYVVENSLEDIKLVVYNGTLNVTEPSIENRLIEVRQNAQEMQNKQFSLLLTFGLSALPEYTLNTFGTNFCEFYTQDYNKKECVSTDLDTSFFFGVTRITVCAAEFSGYFTNIINTNANSIDWRSFKNSPKGQKILREFILSEKGQNIFNYLKGCNYTKNDFLDPQKQIELKQLLNPPVYAQESPTIRVLNGFDTIAYFLILIIVGYIINCIIVYIHRRNSSLAGKGKKVYLVMILFFFIFLLWSVIFRIYTNDIRIEVFGILLLSYIATTLSFVLSDFLEESSLEKAVKKSRKK